MMLRAGTHQRGFTLIEVLVVLVIVAIITAVAVMAFGDFGRRRSEKIHVETFARMLAVARSQAILTPVVMGLTISPRGYQFYRWIDTGKKTKWQLLSDSVLNQPTAFVEFSRIQIKQISQFDPPKTHRADTPAIIILPSGYVTPFDMLLTGRGQQLLLKVNHNGSVKFNELTAEKPNQT